LYVIGDSHSLSAHNIIVKYKEHNMLLNAEWVQGCKQYHLGNINLNRYKHRFNCILERIPKESIALLCFGEIDCRHNEGILAAWKKSKDRTLDELVLSTIRDYISYVSNIAGKYGHKFIICAIPAVNIHQDISPELKTEVANLVGMFNYKLKEETLARNLGFLDIYALTDKGNGIANKEFYIDEHHLIPSTYAKCFLDNLYID
jgi:hypothetical protein